jgi:hypothetical protein
MVFLPWIQCVIWIQDLLVGGRHVVSGRPRLGQAEGGSGGSSRCSCGGWRSTRRGRAKTRRNAATAKAALTASDFDAEWPKLMARLWFAKAVMASLTAPGPLLACCRVI